MGDRMTESSPEAPVPGVIRDGTIFQLVITGEAEVIPGEPKNEE